MVNDFFKIFGGVMIGAFLSWFFNLKLADRKIKVDLQLKVTDGISGISNNLFEKLAETDTILSSIYYSIIYYNNTLKSISDFKNCIEDEKTDKENNKIIKYHVASIADILKEEKHFEDIWSQCVYQFKLLTNIFESNQLTLRRYLDIKTSIFGIYGDLSEAHEGVHLLFFITNKQIHNHEIMDEESLMGFDDYKKTFTEYAQKVDAYLRKLNSKLQNDNHGKLFKIL